MIDMEVIQAFLLDREKRVHYQNQLLAQYKDSTLVTIRVNYPGVKKSNYINDDIIKTIYTEIKRFYQDQIVFDEIYKNREGLIGHILFDLDLVNTKNKMIDIEENHIFGRYLDIDVYSMIDNEVKTISRVELGRQPRKCFICDLDAKLCSRSQKHNIEEIFDKFEESYSNFKTQEKEIDDISYKVSQLALKAMISEVSTFPSFGLVSPVSNGSHKDMDYYTFLDSAVEITPYLREMYKIGHSIYSPKVIFNAIRKVGIECENAMFKATNGINTHKGMIFLMGTVIAAVGKCNYNNYGFDKIKEVLKEMVVDILKDFDSLDTKTDLTHGERLYKEYGFTGIRGQVKEGLSIIFDEIIPKYIGEDLDENKLYTQILIHLMANIEDSTIVYRHDINMLKKVKDDANQLLQIGGVYTDEGIEKIHSMEIEYIEKNISPGGCADLLALTIFLMHLKEEVFTY